MNVGDTVRILSGGLVGLTGCVREILNKDQPRARTVVYVEIDQQKLVGVAARTTGLWAYDLHELEVLGGGQ